MRWAGAVSAADLRAAAAFALLRAAAAYQLSSSPQVAFTYFAVLNVVTGLACDGGGVGKETNRTNNAITVIQCLEYAVGI